jgi:DNA/RNA endonuclease G (NUC1)
MKYLLSLLLLISFTVSAQDTVTITHKAYKTTYSKSKHYPVKVEWWISRASITCDVKAKRGDKFIPDPKLAAETNLQSD